MIPSLTLTLTSVFRRVDPRGDDQRQWLTRTIKLQGGRSRSVKHASRDNSITLSQRATADAVASNTHRKRKPALTYGRELDVAGDVPRRRRFRIECLKFFLRLANAWRTPECAPCAPHVRQAWRRWLSALQLGVLKLAGGVAEWVLRYSGDR
jgi:hypothetical protein